MDAKEFKSRTMRFGLSIIDLVEALPRKVTSEVLGKQLLRAAVSVGANYRAACRAKSSADFVCKLGIVEEEVDETAFWLKLLERRSLADPSRLKPLRQEADELTAMVVASIRTAKGGRSR
ncbi:MAG: four helix bundle protein [Planctomycetes bacterium]|nr:four helix bundle protein [Planctomycetota bacterium]